MAAISKKGFLFNGKNYKISKSFENILENAKYNSDVDKSNKYGYRCLNKEGKIMIYKYIYNKYKITMDSVMNLDNKCYITSKYYSLVKFNHDLRIVIKLRKLGII
jgi:hypothetical protein